MKNVKRKRYRQLGLSGAKCYTKCYTRCLNGRGTLLSSMPTVLVLSVMVLGLLLCTSATKVEADDIYDVDYTINQWNTGFTAHVSITNNSTSPIEGWTLTWTLDDGQQITGSWNAEITQSGDTVTASNDSGHWNGIIAAGGTVSFGFQATHSGDNSIPVDFKLNGAALSGDSDDGSDSEGGDSTDEDAVEDNDSSTDEDAVEDADSDSTDTGTTVEEDSDDSQQGLCQVAYSTNDWNTGFTAEVTVANIGTSPIEGWTLTWTFADGQQITGSWNADVSQSGAQVSTSNDAGHWNGTIAANGGTVSFGFQGTHSGTNSTPSNFELNGVACNGGYDGGDDSDDGDDSDEGDDSNEGDDSDDADSDLDPMAYCPAESSGDAYQDRFMDMWCDLHNPDNGYFSAQGVPYHSVETLIIEAPDHGHETTSEAYSYWLWLEAMYGAYTGDWRFLEAAWESMETYIIPTSDDQPTNRFYSVSSPATYASEWPDPSDYPSPLDSNVTAGQDPIGQELADTYGTWDIYGMHWLLDVDNVYGYGSRGDGTTAPSYINTFQRGEQESVWETVPHPSWEEFNWGGANGFLDLFIGDSSYARQWRYTNAPDADARVVQLLYWAKQAADTQGGSDIVDGLTAKAAKMGDYLRYCLYDKYFKEIGCQSESCAAASGKDSAHYLLSWYYAWGGATDSNAGWAFRIGCSHSHFGYQNPVAAWALSTQSDFIPKSLTAQADWENSLQRQLEFYRWLQSAQGAIAGGATNSVNGNYSAHPDGTSTFYGMAYDDHPVYHDPGSNTWFGWQAWSMERVAEFYYLTGNTLAEQILDDWVPFAMDNTQVTEDDFQIPGELSWQGQPDTWNGTENFTGNADLQVTIESTSQDLGIAAALAKTLAYYSAGKREHTGVEDTDTRTKAFELMDFIWTQYRDDIGVSVTERRGDYSRLDDPVYIPDGWSGTMANGDTIDSDATFLSIRSFYLEDPMYEEVREALDQGQEPTFNYHRFWAQAEVALANAVLGQLFQ